MPQRIPFPPSSVTGELGVWLDVVWRALSDAPTFSVFSGVNPNSSLTGVAGNIAVNIAPSSSVSRVYVKYGSAILPDMQSWQTVA